MISALTRYTKFRAHAFDLHQARARQISREVGAIETWLSCFGGCGVSLPPARDPIRQGMPVEPLEA
jgi:hypothetical protein